MPTDNKSIGTKTEVKTDTKPERSNIYKVAEKAGVSFVTVSRVFNNHPHVSVAMRERVLAAAREVGYSPKLVSKPNRIGLLINDLDDFSKPGHQQTRITQIMRAATEKEFACDFIPIDNLDLATRRHVDGLIAVGIPLADIDNLGAMPDVPIIQTFLSGEATEWNTVTCNSSQEVMLGLNHLHSLGHRKIALVLEGLDIPAMRERHVAFVRNATTPISGSIDDHVFMLGADSADYIAQELVQNKFTAALFMSNHSPLPMFNALRHGHGVAIPQDFSFVALEVPYVSEQSYPGLTSIVQPLENVAEAAVNDMISLIKGADSSPHKIFQSELIIRGTTGPCS